MLSGSTFFKIRVKRKQLQQINGYYDRLFQRGVYARLQSEGHAGCIRDINGVFITGDTNSVLQRHMIR